MGFHRNALGRPNFLHRQIRYVLEKSLEVSSTASIWLSAVAGLAGWFQRIVTMARSLPAVAALLCMGCWEMGQGGDAHVPGDELGTYRVLGTLDESSCGMGAAGSPETWDFSIKLSKMGDELWWLNGREAILGRIGADGVSFAFDTRIEVDVSATGRGQAGCTMVRNDQASGKLSSATLDVAAFAGRLRFTYTPAATADCSLLLGVEGGFARLPCEMTYSLEASRVASGTE